MDVPITFEYEGKLYTGVFSGGTGSGGTMYDHWHLMILWAVTLFSTLWALAIFI